MTEYNLSQLPNWAIDKIKANDGKTLFTQLTGTIWIERTAIGPTLNKVTLSSTTGHKITLADLV